MLANFPAVHPHARLPIHRAKMQQHALGAPLRGHLKLPRVPKPLVLAHIRHHARERGLNGERHKNFSIELLRLRRVLVCNRVIPESVQVEPILAHQLRARVFRVRVLRRHVPGPVRHQASLSRFPIFACAGGSRHRQHKRADEGERFHCFSFIITHDKGNHLFAFACAHM